MLMKWIRLYKCDNQIQNMFKYADIQTCRPTWTDSLSRKILFQETSNEGRLAHRILTQYEHHWLGVKVARSHGRGGEVRVLGGYFQGKNLLLVKIL